MPAHVPPSLSLTRELQRLIEREIASGRYGSADEVVWAGLHRLKAEHDEGRTESAASVDSDERLRALADNLPNGMVYQVIAEADGGRRFRFVSASVERLFGVSVADVLRDAGTLYERVPEDYRARVAEAEAAALNARSPFTMEIPLRLADSRIGWFHVSSSPRTMADGLVLWEGIVLDITERRAAEERLRESEARFRNMADSAPALIWMTDVNGRVTFANMQFDDVFGRPAREMLGNGWARQVHPDDLNAFRKAFQTAFAERRPFRIEIRAFDKDREIRWLRCDGVARLSDAGEFLGYTGCAVDITDARRAEDHLRLLVNELNHRVKNTLTTVQALARQTLRRVGTPEHRYESFQARLLALSRAHDVLTRQNWGGADIDEVVARAIEMHQTPGTDRFRTEGEPVRLSPRIALALAMALHELATNAVKYGALSTEAGRVEIAWGLSPRSEERTLRLRWTERGGPAVEPPRRQGFGRRLIEQGLANDLGGIVQLAFERPGLTCTIEAPLRGFETELTGGRGSSRLRS